MFKILNRRTPEYLQDLFKPACCYFRSNVMDFLLSTTNNNYIQRGNCRAILKIGNGESENRIIRNGEREIFQIANL